MQYQYAPCVKAQSAEKRHARDQRMIEKSKSTYQRYNPHGARLGEKEGTGQPWNDPPRVSLRECSRIVRSSVLYNLYERFCLQWGLSNRVSSWTHGVVTSRKLDSREAGRRHGHCQTRTPRGPRVAKLYGSRLCLRVCALCIVYTREKGRGEG